MKFARKLLGWLRALFGIRPVTEFERPVKEFAYDEYPDDIIKDFVGDLRQKVRSANICIVSTGATQRERSNAKSALRRLGG